MKQEGIQEVMATEEYLVVFDAFQFIQYFTVPHLFLQESGHSSGIPVESTGIPVESCRNPVIPVEFQWNPQEFTGIPLEFPWNQAD